MLLKQKTFENSKYTTQLNVTSRRKYYISDRFLIEDSPGKNIQNFLKKKNYHWVSIQHLTNNCYQIYVESIIRNEIFYLKAIPL